MIELYKPEKGVTMSERRYYMKLLEGRAKRLGELLEVSAPTDMICKEIMLLVDAARPLEPKAFKSWEKNTNEEYQPERFKCATG